MSGDIGHMLTTAPLKVECKINRNCFHTRRMKMPSGPGRPSSPLLIELRGMFARTWVASLMRATAAKNLKELAERCNKLLPDTYPKRIRDWEKYGSGKHAPSLDRSGAPGIVRILGAHYPESLRIAEHVIWVALDPEKEIDTATADRLLAKLHPIVTDPFVSSRTETAIVRNWGVLNAPRQHFPEALALAMDYIASYLLLFRSCKASGPPSIWVNMLDDLAVAVSLAPNSIELAPLGSEIERFIDQAFLSPNIGPRWQAPDWPFYRGLPTQTSSTGSAGAVVLATDAAGNLRSTVRPSGLERGLAVLLDNYPIGPTGPAVLRSQPARRRR